MLNLHVFLKITNLLLKLLCLLLFLFELFVQLTILLSGLTQLCHQAMHFLIGLMLLLQYLLDKCADLLFLVVRTSLAGYDTVEPEVVLYDAWGIQRRVWLVNQPCFDFLVVFDFWWLDYSTVEYFLIAVLGIVFLCCLARSHTIFKVFAILKAWGKTDGNIAICEWFSDWVFLCYGRLDQI